MEGSLLSIAILLCLAAILLSFGVRAADRYAMKTADEALAEVTADAMAAENVRRYLDGTIIGPPNEGTLADRVHLRCIAEFIAGEKRSYPAVTRD